LKIPFYKRFQPAEQLKLIESALIQGDLSSRGAFTEKLQEHFELWDQIRHIRLVTSASSALELAMLVIAPEPGAEFIIPSYNFPSAANGVLRAGGVPVLCDSDPVTKNICLADAAAKISKKTRGIIPTHYGGISCDMDQLMELCRSEGLLLIEDAAQGVGSTYKGQALGNLGDFGAYSFHHTKNYSSGEGGAFLCREDKWMEKAEILMDNGTDRSRFLREGRNSYSWQQGGSNMILGEAPAAILYGQMLHRVEIREKRGRVHHYYSHIFQEKSLEEKQIFPMKLPDYGESNYHIYYLDCPSLEVREQLRTGLLEDGIDVRAHYVPLHSSGKGRKMGLLDRDFPGSTRIAETILRLPIHTELTEEELAYTAERVLQRIRML
jgi:dTDP-4-amino-4,6-dideoxygalactose transaminase